ncbi:MAG: hypothetical protein ACFFAE_20070 [Candidatus Hodarchaeota archaeon]
MNRMLFPFTTPINPQTITVTKNFSYHQILFPTAGKEPGIRFKGTTQIPIRSVASGTLYVAINENTDSDPREFPDLLTVIDPVPSIPEVGDPEYINYKVDLFLRPNPVFLKTVNVVLANRGRGSLVGFRYSDISFSNLYNASDVDILNSGTLNEALTSQNVVIVDTAGNISSDWDYRWNYFFNGIFSIFVSGGLAIATIEPEQEVGFSVLTTKGYIDPIEFFSLTGGFLNDYNEYVTLRNITEDVFSLAPIPHFNHEDLTPDPGRYNDIIQLSKEGYITSTYFNVIASQYHRTVPTVFRDVGGEFVNYNNIDNKQKGKFLEELHSIGDPNNDFSYSAITPAANPYEVKFSWFRNWDWQNIFQLEANCEFYLNFHYPFSGGFPLNPDHEHYRIVNFDTDLIVDRRQDAEVDDISPTLPNGDPNPTYISDNPYPKEEFPFIIVCIDDFEHIGGKLEHGEQFHCKVPNDNRPRDKYQGMMFVIERFQSLDDDQNAVGYPRVIGKFPWTSHSSQRWGTRQERSSIAGNILYIAYSMTALNKRHNFCFQVGNSYHISIIPSATKPTNRDVLQWGKMGGGTHMFTNPLPGILDPLNHTINPQEHAALDSNGKGSILFHRGFYGNNRNGTGSQGCNVSPRPKFYEFRELIISNYLKKYDPNGDNANLDFMRTIKNTMKQDANETLWDNASQAEKNSWISFIPGNPNTPKIRCLYFLIRPNEPNIMGG